MLEVEPPARGLCVHTLPTSTQNRTPPLDWEIRGTVEGAAHTGLLVTQAWTRAVPTLPQPEGALVPPAGGSGGFVVHQEMIPNEECSKDRGVLLFLQQREPKHHTLQPH